MKIGFHNVRYINVVYNMGLIHVTIRIRESSFTNVRVVTSSRYANNIIFHGKWTYGIILPYNTDLNQNLVLLPVQFAMIIMWKKTEMNVKTHGRAEWSLSSKRKLFRSWLRECRMTYSHTYQTKKKHSRFFISGKWVFWQISFAQLGFWILKFGLYCGVNRNHFKIIMNQ